MIQFKRGSTNNWRKLKNPLDAGQPGYDKDKHKIKIGDGKTSWDALPYASGMFRDEIITSEESAKKHYNPILALLGIDERPIFTYGPESPDDNTVGEVYLQHYDAEPEVDYIVEYGTHGMWQYQKFKSGFARCWGTLLVHATVQNEFESIDLFHSDTVQEKYPFTFKEVPCEVASLSSPSGMAWLAGSTIKNSEDKTASYRIISADSLADASYSVSFTVEGLWR